MFIIGTGEGKRLDVYEYDTGWNGPSDPNYSVLAECMQHGYIFKRGTSWGYQIDKATSITYFESLHQLFTSIDSNAVLDMPDDLMEWWEDEVTSP